MWTRCPGYLGDAPGHDALDLLVALFQRGAEQRQRNGRDNAEDKGTDHGSCQAEVPANDGRHRGGAPAGDDLGGAQTEAVPGMGGPLGWFFGVVVAGIRHLLQLCPFSQFCVDMSVIPQTGVRPIGGYIIKVSMPAWPFPQLCPERKQ
jgi:hypothetical protein